MLWYLCSPLALPQIASLSLEGACAYVCLAPSFCGCCPMDMSADSLALVVSGVSAQGGQWYCSKQKKTFLTGYAPSDQCRGSRQKYQFHSLPWKTVPKETNFHIWKAAACGSSQAPNLTLSRGWLQPSLETREVGRCSLCALPLACSKSPVSPWKDLEDTPHDLPLMASGASICKNHRTVSNKETVLFLV